MAIVVRFLRGPMSSQKTFACVSLRYRKCHGVVGDKK